MTIYSMYLTCAGSLAFPGVGLRGFGVEGASPVLDEPGSSFLRVGARSSPFPCGECGGLPAGELGSWGTSEMRKFFNVLLRVKQLRILSLQCQITQWFCCSLSVYTLKMMKSCPSMFSCICLIKWFIKQTRASLITCKYGGCSFAPDSCKLDPT